MLNGESGRLETKEPRDFTSAERKQLFLAWKRADAQRERLKREVEGWHEIDDVLTPDQIAETPRHPDHVDRSQAVWVKSFHAGLAENRRGEGLLLL